MVFVSVGYDNAFYSVLIFFNLFIHLALAATGNVFAGHQGFFGIIAVLAVLNFVRILFASRRSSSYFMGNHLCGFIQIIVAEKSTAQAVGLSAVIRAEGQFFGDDSFLLLGKIITAGKYDGIMGIFGFENVSIAIADSGDRRTNEGRKNKQAN